MDETPSNQAKPGKTPNREFLYAEAAKHAPRAIEILVSIMENGDNDNAKMGAAKAILAKAIPDLRSIELNNKDGQPFLLSIVAGGYVPPTGAFSTTPKGSHLQPLAEIQDSSLAPQSQENHDSDHGTRQTSPS